MYEKADIEKDDFRRKLVVHEKMGFEKNQFEILELLGDCHQAVAYNILAASINVVLIP